MNNRFKYINNALIYPATNDWKGGLYTHGVGTEDDHEVSIGQFKFGRQLIDTNNRKELKETSKPKKINGTYLYLGAASSHFGHFFSECISRYWALEPALGLQVDGVIILPDSGGRGEKYVEITLDLLKLRRKDIIFIKDYSIVDTIIIPEQGCITGEKPKQFYTNFLEERTHPSFFEQKKLPKKIFISRRYFKNYGRVAGMDYVAAEIKKKGFFEFIPEKYTILQQIQFICSAKEIIWEEGSSVHLLELLPHLNSRQILIMRRELTNFDYIKFILEHKSHDVTTYSNVSFIECLAPPHNKMSKINDLTEFSEFIEFEIGVPIDKEKLRYESILDEVHFILFEEKNKPSENKSTFDKLTKIINRDFYPPEHHKLIRTENASSIGPKPIVAWCIDFPPKGISETVSFKDINIRGWFILEENITSEASDYSMQIVSHSGATYDISLDIDRPDVIKAILGQNCDNKSDKCGFSNIVEFDSEYRILLHYQNKSVLLCTIEVE